MHAYVHIYLTKSNIQSAVVLSTWLLSQDASVCGSPGGTDMLLPLLFKLTY